MRRNIPTDEKSPARRGRPRTKKIVSAQLDGDMAYKLEMLAEADGRPTGGMLRKILAVALETPELWIGEQN